LHQTIGFRGFARLLQQLAFGAEVIKFFVHSNGFINPGQGFFVIDVVLSTVVSGLRPALPEKLPDALQVMSPNVIHYQLVGGYVNFHRYPQFFPRQYQRTSFLLTSSNW
jgi:hypothetical protein